MMSKVMLKENIWIEGFDSESLFRQRLYGSRGISNKVILIYQGKTSNIPEIVAKGAVGINIWEGCLDSYKNYGTGAGFKTSTDSINSACREEYCIIYKMREPSNLFRFIQ